MDKMTSKQKHIASCINPYWNDFATKEEVKKAKELAKGKYWDEVENYQYCAFTPGGKRRFFAYDHTEVYDAHLMINVYDFLNAMAKKKAKRAALFWSMGWCKEAGLVDNDSIR